jgi:hypothetical protein
METLRKFESVEDVRGSLESAGYICSQLLATVVFLAQATQKPPDLAQPGSPGFLVYRRQRNARL